MIVKRTEKHERIAIESAESGDVVEIMDAESTLFEELVIVSGLDEDHHNVLATVLSTGERVELDVETLALVVRGAFVEDGA